MNESGFDSFARRFAATTGRRSLFRSIAGGLLAAFTFRTGEAAASLQEGELRGGGSDQEGSATPCPGDGQCHVLQIDLAAGIVEPDTCSVTCFSEVQRDLAIERGSAADGPLTEQVQILRSELADRGFAPRSALSTLFLVDTSGATLREFTGEPYIDAAGREARLSYITDFDRDPVRSLVSAVIEPGTARATLLFVIDGELGSITIDELRAAMDEAPESTAGGGEVKALAAQTSSGATPLSTAGCTRFYHQMCSGVGLVSCEIVFGRVMGKALSMADTQAMNLLKQYAGQAWVKAETIRWAIDIHLRRMPFLARIPESRIEERIGDLFDLATELAGEAFHELTGIPTICEMIDGAGCGSTDSDALFYQCCQTLGGQSCGSICCPDTVACGPGGSGTCGCEAHRLCANDICCADTHICEDGVCVPEEETAPEDELSDDPGALGCDFIFPDDFLEWVEATSRGPIYGAFCAPGGNLNARIQFGGPPPTSNCIFSFGYSISGHHAENVLVKSDSYTISYQFEMTDWLVDYPWVAIFVQFNMQPEFNNQPDQCFSDNEPGAFIVQIVP
ncbi:MAG: hypothetical protein KF883_05455 [Thermomicrobiales bacterium]|nr:hypothetical protein [Thermomicrobiales bacterium]